MVAAVNALSWLDPPKKAFTPNVLPCNFLLSTITYGEGQKHKNRFQLQVLSNQFYFHYNCVVVLTIIKLFFSKYLTMFLYFVVCLFLFSHSQSQGKYKQDLRSWRNKKKIFEQIVSVINISVKLKSLIKILCVYLYRGKR